MNEEYKENLMKAWVKLNDWEWDDAVGEKPESFDDMPKAYTGFNEIKSDEVTKHQYISPKMRWIEDQIGLPMCSWAWWKYELNRTYEEWNDWYYGERIRIENGEY